MKNEQCPRHVFEMGRAGDLIVHPPLYPIPSLSFISLVTPYMVTTRDCEFD